MAAVASSIQYSTKSNSTAEPEPRRRGGQANLGAEEDRAASTPDRPARRRTVWPAASGSRTPCTRRRGRRCCPSARSPASRERRPATARRRTRSVRRRTAAGSRVRPARRTSKLSARRRRWPARWRQPLRQSGPPLGQVPLRCDGELGNRLGERRQGSTASSPHRSQPAPTAARLETAGHPHPPSGRLPPWPAGTRSGAPCRQC